MANADLFDKPVFILKIELFENKIKMSYYHGKQKVIK